MNVRAVYDQGPDYLLNWSVQQDVSYSGLSRITEVGPVPTVGAVNTSRNCYMPIVYDYNDTAYNCNPASRSAFNQATFAGGLAYSGAFVLSGSGATLDNSTGARLTESYGAYWNFSNNATWHHQIINGSSLVGISAGGGNFGGGNILASGNITAYYSDERLKTKLTTIKNALDKVRSLEGFIYVENDLAKSLGYTNSNEQAGVSAQRVKAVLPQAVSLAPVDMQGVPETGEIVSKSGENYLTVDYSRIVPLLIEAIKEQDTEITTLRSQLQQQQSELDELKSLVKSLLANR
jgi:chaperonin cofactor prefoldin